MPRNGLAYIAIPALTLLSMLAIGCGDGRMAKKGGRLGGARTTAKAGRSKKLRAAPILDDADNGAGSIKELAELRKKESAQTKMIVEMREALAQGEDVVEREERKLRDIRNRLAGYDADAETYDPRGARGNPGVRPADYAERREYVQPGREMPGQANGNRGERRVGGERKASPYRGAGESRSEYAPANNASRSDYGEYDESGRFAGEDASYRDSGSAAAPGSRNLGNVDQQWNPSENLYYDGGEEFQVPPPRTAAAPANRRPLPKTQTGIRPPAQRREAELRVETDADLDEAFVPDLYLSGGR